MAKTVADLLVERLIGWEIDTIFGFPGDGINGVFEALRTHQDRLKFIQVRHAGQILPHQVLLEQVWGPQCVGDANYLKVFVRRLRQKLGDDAEHPRYIQTEWGIGYRFVRPS